MNHFQLLDLAESCMANAEASARDKDNERAIAMSEMAKAYAAVAQARMAASNRFV